MLRPFDVAVEHRLNGAVHCRRHPALILAIFGNDLVPYRHVLVRPKGPHDVGGVKLVRRIGVGVNEVDHHGLGPGREQGARSRRDFLLIERAINFARRSHALGHFDPEFSGNDGFETSDESIRSGTGPAAEFKHVPEAPSRDEPTARELALEDNVGCSGRAVDKEAYFRRRQPSLA